MYQKAIHLFLLAFVLGCFGCEAPGNKISAPEASQETQINDEKAEILLVINEETKAAFNRDYEGWKDKWVQQPYVTKTYIQWPDSTFSEMLGWEAINQFVKSYLEAHPEPVPVPALVDDIEVRWYGQGAWVSYEQQDPERGLKRETRLMEKIQGQWKIAGMHTTIYGFTTEE